MPAKRPAYLLGLGQQSEGLGDGSDVGHDGGADYAEQAGHNFLLHQEVRSNQEADEADDVGNALPDHAVHEGVVDVVHEISVNGGVEGEDGSGGESGDSCNEGKLLFHGDSPFLVGSVGWGYKVFAGTKSNRSPTKGAFQ